MSRPAVSATLRNRVVAKSRNRCGYCLTSRLISGSTMQLDHLQPYSEGGPTDELNLWLACNECNQSRSDRTAGIDPETLQAAPLFNPRDDAWSDHFEWASGGKLIVGRTPTGRATVSLLKMNRESIVLARATWIVVGLHPPQD
jgi:5-methylcytosine-specific restriction endonuclease McrA